MTEYYQHVLTRSGSLRTSMYSSGPSCASIELARELPGDLSLRDGAGERVAIVRRERAPGNWTDSSGNSHPRWGKPVIMEIVGVVNATKSDYLPYLDLLAHGPLPGVVAPAKLRRWYGRLVRWALSRSPDPDSRSVAVLGYLDEGQVVPRNAVRAAYAAYAAAHAYETYDADDANVSRAASAAYTVACRAAFVAYCASYASCPSVSVAEKFACARALYNAAFSAAYETECQEQLTLLEILK